MTALKPLIHLSDLTGPVLEHTFDYATAGG